MRNKSIARLILRNQKNRTKNVRLRKMGYVIYLSLGVTDAINEHIKNLESNYDVRVISVDIDKDEYCKYSVWLELRRKY